MLSGLLLATACGHAGSPHAAVAPSEAEAHAGAIAAQVSVLRALPQKSAVVMRFVDDDAFLRAFTAHLTAQARVQGIDADKALADQRALWISLDFLAPQVDAGRMVGGVAQQQLRGYYDASVHTLFVRDKFPAATLEGTLAHELEHALQDQYFGLPVGKRFSDDDTRMAASSAFEGDAQLTAFAYVAKKANKPLAETMATQALMMHKLPTEALIQMTGLSPALMSAPALFRERFLFPYLAGLDLMITLYRAGGFALVDQVLTHPPQSSEQVLHPEKYLAGERPIPVREPALPNGYRAVTSGRLGELGARVLLARCLPWAAAQERASGWGGDQYRIVEGPDHALAFLWSTVWDDEAHARAFEEALHQQERCWKNQPAAGKEPFIRNLNVQSRQGTAVVFVRGLPVAEAQPLLPSLLALAEPALPNAPPVGAVALPKEPEIAKLTGDSDGRLDGNVYTSQRLDLKVPTPPGFAAQVGAVPALMIHAPKPAKALGTFSFVPEAIDPEQYFRLSAATIGASIGGGRKIVPESGGGAIDLGWSKGVERTWVIEGSPVHLRGLLVPLCGGKATMAFTQVWAVPAAKAALDGWIASFAPQGQTAPPVCDTLGAHP